MQFLWLLPSLLVGVYLGVSSGMWQLAVMSGLSAATALIVSRVRSKSPQSIESVRIDARGVRVNGRRLGLFWSRAERAAVAAELERLFPPPKVNLSTPLSFSAGLELDLNLLTHGPHLFVVGPTGSGKSRWLHRLLSTLTGSPRLLLADYKGGATLESFGECVTDLDTPEVRIRFWEAALDLLEERERYLRAHRASRIEEVGLERVILVLDELGHALRMDRKAHEVLCAVAARGRSLGVHLVCANQSVAGVPRELLVNLGLRVILAGADEVDALQLGAKATPKPKQSIGTGLAIGVGEFEFPFRPEQSQALPTRASVR